MRNRGMFLANRWLLSCVFAIGFGSGCTRVVVVESGASPVLPGCDSPSDGGADLAPDLGADMPVDMPVVAGAPAAYFATLPVRAIADALRAAGLAAEVSNSAGTFVCNHVFYGLMHLAATGGNFRGGFLHVPSLQRQSTHASGAAPIPLDDIVRGIRIALEVSAASPVSVPGRS